MWWPVLQSWRPALAAQSGSASDLQSPLIRRAHPTRKPEDIGSLRCSAGTTLFEKESIVGAECKQGAGSRGSQGRMWLSPRTLADTSCRKQAREGLMTTSQRQRALLPYLTFYAYVHAEDYHE